MIDKARAMRAALREDTAAQLPATHFATKDCAWAGSKDYALYAYVSREHVGLLTKSEEVLPDAYSIEEDVACVHHEGIFVKVHARERDLLAIYPI